VVVVSIITVWWLRSTNTYSARLWSSPPTRWSDYFSVNYIRWNLQGRKSSVQVALHQLNCLSNWVDQGVMSRRSYRFQKPLDLVAFQKLIDHARSAGQISRDDVGIYSYCVTQPSLELVAFTSELPVWDRIVSEVQAIKP